MTRANRSGGIRIIAGSHRGRRLPVAELPGLRPTTDRVRETLFNWLAPVIEGSRCLDCFAGTGALGFEAASRAAAQVVMLERSAPAARHLRDNANRLADPAIAIHLADSLRWLKHSPAEQGLARFDICFLDPPFADDLILPTLSLLQRQNWLRNGARIYLETAAKPGLPQLPDGIELLKEKRAGQVVYALARLATCPRID